MAELEENPTGVSRDHQGRFGSGNRFARGNPHAKRIGELRAAMLEAVSPEDLKAIILKLVEKAKAGDTVAAREILDRCLGKPIELDVLERLDELEAIASEVAK